ncbi:MAG: hypothetical protein ABIR91_04065, partial [Candidatus Saccharimonadales bacterium]
IQTGSKWWVLDPYFRTLTTLDDTPVQLHRAEQFVTNNPHRVIAKRTRPLSQELNIEHRFQALEQCMPYLHQLHASRDEWDYSTTAFACLLNSYRPECSFDDDAIPESVLNDIEVNLAMSLCSTRTLDRFFALDKGDPERSISALVESKFDLASRNKRHRNQSLIRTVLLLVRKWYLSVLDIEQEDAPAKLQEYSHPTYHLAIQTTRQLAYDRKVDAADSCLYSSSQWVLHDSIDAVRKSGNKRYAQVHAQRIDKIRRHPSIALPQIRRFL